MKRWHLWLATALLALLTGCASGPRYSDVYQNIPPPAEDQGRILFYRSSVLGAAVQPDLRLDGNVVGSFSPRGFFYVDRPLGRYTAQARTEVEARLDIDVIPQRTSYVEMSIGIGFLVGQPRLKLRTPVEALPELNDLAYIGKQAPVSAPISPAASPPVMAASTSAPVSTAQATVTSAPDRVPNSGTADAVPSQTAAPASNFPTGIPHVIEYRLDDRMGGPPRNVSFRFLEQVDGRVSFNNGTWIESPDGAVIESNSQIAGDFDSAMPPGGWVPKANDLTPGASWLSRYSRKSGGGRTDMDVTAVVGGKETLVIAGRALPAVRVDYRGYTTRIGNSVASSQNQTGKYEATAWYSPELRRVVRFAAKTRGGIGGGTFVVDEELNLVSMR
ncbi:hypothetical protein QTH91_20935 [Variovorax dokdonensis]|uniref:DUF2846 domain-containing protein n=1 Tax=Variovorax dokdonensis TaxID=344883 RepID=A0ABT7NGK5_9BURK|nr:hypothetical protein [Variovorax dokdonensis]MDM0046970.1 hypothetical protein [Variovorax dokdonensis]